MSATAGWYRDPSGVPAQLRWWDGSRWTDHVTPDPSAVPAGAPGAADAHEGAATGGQDPTQPPPPTGTPDAGPAWQAGSGGWGSGDATRPAWQVDTPVPTSGRSVRTGLIVAAVVGVLVLGVVALLVAQVFWAGPVSFGGFDEPSFTDEWTADGAFDDWASDDVIDGGVLPVGESVRAELPFEATYEFTVEIDEAGTYTFDARGRAGFDGMLAVRGPDGEDLLADNDDRGGSSDDVGGEDLDPFLELDLAPGTYLVHVRGWAGDGGTFDLAVEQR